MQDRVVLRPAALEDARDIYEINRTSLGYAIGWDMLYSQFKKILGNPDHRVWVAQTEEGGVWGYVHACRYECLFGGPMKNIISLAVSPRAQGHGVGRRLVEAVEAWAEEEDSFGVRLISGCERTSAHRFYEKLGYRNREDYKNFYKLVLAEEECRRRWEANADREE